MNRLPLAQWIRRIGAAKLLEAVTEGNEPTELLVVDARLNVLFVSRAAMNRLGFGGNPPYRANLSALVEDAHAPPVKALFSRIGTHEESLLFRCADGRTDSKRSRILGVADETGQWAGTLIWIKSDAPRPALPPPSEDKSTEEFHGLVTRDPGMKAALRIIRNVAETDATVLIRGESGTGKELVARALHRESPRGDQAFLAVNCAALTPTLLESELFGHVRGAFTGALKDHAGLFQRADRGTLFLDEVAELPLDLQAKLLRVIQERSFTPVGGDRSQQVDVRIVAATHRSLREEVKARRFREDLMYRLRVVPIFLPPLRERRQDVALLLTRLIDRHNRSGRRHVSHISPEAMKRLLDYSWPGNVRELQNVVEYAFAVGRGETLVASELPPEFHEGADPATSRNTMPHGLSECDRIRAALQRSEGKIEAAASLLGISRATLWRKRKRCGL